MGEFRGIMFALKKAKSNNINYFENQYIDYVVFGYYDGLSIVEIDKWYEFRPMGVAAKCGYVELGKPFSDIYVIKGIFPPSDSALWKDYKISKRKQI